MTSNEMLAGSERTSGAESRHGRRHFVQLSGVAVAVGLVGCSDLELGTGDEEDGTPEDATGDAENGAETATSTDDPTGTDGPTETEAEGDIHEHGTLYIEIDGERHEFTDPKYRQAGQHPDGAASDVFHFHDDGNPYYWHMEGVRLTLTDALESLPDIAIETEDGGPVFEFEGETYVHGEDGVEIEVRQRDVAVDPEEYELRDGDIIWIEVVTDGNDA